MAAQARLNHVTSQRQLWPRDNRIIALPHPKRAIGDKLPSLPTPVKSALFSGSLPGICRVGGDGMNTIRRWKPAVVDKWRRLRKCRCYWRKSDSTSIFHTRWHTFLELAHFSRTRAFAWCMRSTARFIRSHKTSTPGTGQRIINAFALKLL